MFTCQCERLTCIFLHHLAFFFLGLLESIGLNGNAHGSNNNCGEKEGSGVRHRATSAGEEISEDGATDGAKSYTAEQLDAVKQCVYFYKRCFKHHVINYDTLLVAGNVLSLFL